MGKYRHLFIFFLLFLTTQIPCDVETAHLYPKTGKIAQRVDVQNGSVHFIRWGRGFFRPPPVFRPRPPAYRPPRVRPPVVKPRIPRIAPKFNRQSKRSFRNKFGLKPRVGNSRRFFKPNKAELRKSFSRAALNKRQSNRPRSGIRTKATSRIKKEGIINKTQRLVRQAKLGMRRSSMRMAKLSRNMGARVQVAKWKASQKGVRLAKTTGRLLRKAGSLPIKTLASKKGFANFRALWKSKKLAFLGKHKKGYDSSGRYITKGGKPILIRGKKVSPHAIKQAVKRGVPPKEILKALDKGVLKGKISKGEKSFVRKGDKAIVTTKDKDKTITTIIGKQRPKF